MLHPGGLVTTLMWARGGGPARRPTVRPAAGAVGQVAGLDGLSVGRLPIVVILATSAILSLVLKLGEEQKELSYFHLNYYIILFIFIIINRVTTRGSVKM